jgi:hypothetical protein
MNLRQWARATHTKIADQPAEIHHKDYSIADIEMILRRSIRMLTEALIRGEDLRLRDLVARRCGTNTQPGLGPDP